MVESCEFVGNLPGMIRLFGVVESGTGGRGDWIGGRKVTPSKEAASA